MKVIALIPAKGTSKRLPNKNLLPCAGIPLVTRAIRCAKEAGIFSDVVVSTDSPAIAQIAQDEHARILWRPKVLCEDGVEWAAVVSHFLAALNYDMDAFAVLGVTSPQRIVEDLQFLFEMFRDRMQPAISSGESGIVFCTVVDFLRRMCNQEFWHPRGALPTWHKTVIDINTQADLDRCNELLS